MIKKQLNLRTMHQFFLSVSSSILYFLAIFNQIKLKKRKLLPL